MEVKKSRKYYVVFTLHFPMWTLVKQFKTHCNVGSTSGFTSSKDESKQWSFTRLIGKASENLSLTHRCSCIATYSLIDSGSETIGWQILALKPAVDRFWFETIGWQILVLKPAVGTFWLWNLRLTDSGFETYDFWSYIFSSCQGVSK